MKEYLIKMLDGGLKNVTEEKDCEWSGCETCDYGSKYITEFTLELDGIYMYVTLGNMYDSPYSEEELMKLLCSNIELISNMTQSDFMVFVKERVREVCGAKGYDYEPEFRKIVKM